MLMPMTIGQFIKQLREARNIQQKKLASDIEVGQATVSQWESGRQEPNPTQRKKLAQYFGITEAELYGAKPLPTPDMSNRVPVLPWESANKKVTEDDIPIGLECVSASFSAKENTFALRIVDDSMTPEFYAGDIIIIDEVGTPEHGDYILVADNKGKVPLFRQYRKYGKVEVLHPLNSNHQDIILENERRFTIVGRIAEKLRKY